MSQLFSPRADFILRSALAAVLGLGALATGLMIVLPRSVWARGTHLTPQQPAPFSHEHHVAGLGLDCRYCHSSVETSSFAGLPATAVCMNCHQEIWRTALLLEPVRRSWETATPLRWTRVYRVPDFVYFNHAVHVANGIDCKNCHGDVAQMPLTRQAQPLLMEWCLRCHRDPPVAVPTVSSSRYDREHASSFHPATLLTNCTACHR